MSVIVAIDQGTTSTRCLVFDQAERVVGQSARQVTQSFQQPGWVEHDANELWQQVQETVLEALGAAGRSARDVVALGVANQRETCLIWDRATHQPLSPALVWQDTRTAELCAELAAVHGKDGFRPLTGLPISTYFSASKLHWWLREHPELAARARRGELALGTIDSWLAYRLTGRHVTDVTNASRTQLFDIQRLEWSQTLLDTFSLDAGLMPEVVASSGVIALCKTLLPGVPLTGLLGDQQAALVGQGCLRPGQLKNTYGTGGFAMLHTGAAPVVSRHGLLTTLAYQFGNNPAQYALEGSVAIAGAAVRWLRDGLGLIGSIAELEPLAASVKDAGGVTFVPAFGGLFAPHWRDDARGVLLGLTQHTTKAHVARATLEGVAMQTAEVLDIMAEEGGYQPDTVRVDGAMSRNNLFLQCQADLLGYRVQRSAMQESTALGAARAAAYAVGFWSPDEAVGVPNALAQSEPHVGEAAARTFEPTRDNEFRLNARARWSGAVSRSLGLGKL